YHLHQLMTVQPPAVHLVESQVCQDSGAQASETCDQRSDLVGASLPQALLSHPTLRHAPTLRDACDRCGEAERSRSGRACGREGDWWAFTDTNRRPLPSKATARAN